MKNMNRRTAARFVLPPALALMGFLATPAWTQSERRLHLSTAINRAGRMRALSQRASKAYVQGVLGIMTERAQDIVHATQSLITAGLNDLNRGSVPADVAPLLRTLEQRSQALLSLTSQDAKRDSVVEVVRLADGMLISAEDLTRGYEKMAAQGAARLVNVAGRQRMLSQRAARAYLLLGVGQAGPEIRTQLNDARKEFAEGLAFLQVSALTTSAIRNEIELAKGQWVFFDAALQKAPTPSQFQVIATTSERIYEVMDNLTAMYDQAVRDLFT